jgi:PAS domain S-box-containing protein
MERADVVGAEARTAVEQGTGALRQELESVRGTATTASAELAAARAEISVLRQQSEKILEEAAMSRQQAQAAMQRAQAGDQRMEQLNSELTFALSQLDELKAGLTSAGQAAIIARREAESAKRAAVEGSEKNNERVSEVFREIIGLAARGGGGGGSAAGGSIQRRAELGKLRAKRESEVKEIPTRGPRHGFDDAAQPMAVLNLDGKFCELNAAFSKLVGYQEHEFLKAVWPSVHDRGVYKEQTEQLALMKAGELESVKIQSSYMHSQGLMVPVDGVLALVRGDDGEPVSLLLTADER